MFTVNCLDIFPVKSLTCRPATVMKSEFPRELNGLPCAERKLSCPAATNFPSQLLSALGALIGNCSVTIDEIDIDRRTWRKVPVPAAVAGFWERASITELHKSPSRLSSGSKVNTRAARGRVAIILPGFGHVTRLTFVGHGNLTSRQETLLNLLSACVAQARADRRLVFGENRISPEQTALRSSQPVRLTPRENEVLRWVAHGKRNREIGVILNTSSRTIQKHVQSILDKLNVETRGAAAAWWFEQTGTGV
jgi:DNA-binding CsgD family transcriptional regulator